MVLPTQGFSKPCVFGGFTRNWWQRGFSVNSICGTHRHNLCLPVGPTLCARAHTRAMDLRVHNSRDEAVTAGWVVGQGDELQPGPAFQATLRLLEWPRVCQFLSECACTSAGKQACMQLGFPRNQVLCTMIPGKTIRLQQVIHTAWLFIQRSLASGARPGSGAGLWRHRHAGGWFCAFTCPQGGDVLWLAASGSSELGHRCRATAEASELGCKGRAHSRQRGTGTQVWGPHCFPAALQNCILSPATPWHNFFLFLLHK